METKHRLLKGFPFGLKQYRHLHRRCRLRILTQLILLPWIIYNTILYIELVCPRKRLLRYDTQQWLKVDLKSSRTLDLFKTHLSINGDLLLCKPEKNTDPVRLRFRKKRLLPLINGKIHLNHKHVRKII